MNGLKEEPEKQSYEISIRFIFSDGHAFVQPLSIDESQGVQDLIDWFRDPKAIPVWTWRVPSVQKSHMLHKSHIIGIDIEGYIEPEGNDSKWYERWFDKLRTKWIMRG